MKKPLGTIRISTVSSLAQGPFFDIPYFEEGDYGRLVQEIKASGHFLTDSVFIPLNNINFVVRIPVDVINKISKTEPITSSIIQ